MTDWTDWQDAPGDRCPCAPGTLNEASRAYIGQCVGVAAAQMDGRVVH